MLKPDWSKHSDIIRWVGLTFAALTGAVIMLTIGLSIGGGLGYYEAQADGYAAQYPNETDQRVAECFDQAVGASAKKCTQDAIEAGRDDQRSEKDLGAQQQMAQWAYWLLLLTVAQSLLGIGGFIALLVTIQQGRDANKITRETGRKQVRAYLGVTSVTMEDGDNGDPKFVVNLSNNGVSPADVTRLRISVIWMGTPVETVMVSDVKVEFRVHAAMPTTIPVDITSGIDKCVGDGFFIVSIVIIYKDIFTDTQAEECYFRTNGKVQLFDMDLPERLSATPLKSTIENLQAKRKAESEKAET